MLKLCCEDSNDLAKVRWIVVKICYPDNGISGYLVFVLTGYSKDGIRRC